MRPNGRIVLKGDAMRFAQRMIQWLAVRFGRPVSQYRGEVTECPHPQRLDEVVVTFDNDTPERVRVRCFPLKRLEAVGVDYVGARVLYRMFEIGGVNVTVLEPDRPVLAAGWLRIRTSGPSDPGFLRIRR